MGHCDATDREVARAGSVGKDLNPGLIVNTIPVSVVIGNLDCKSPRRNSRNLQPKCIPFLQEHRTRCCPASYRECPIVGCQFKTPQFPQETNP